MLSDAKGFVNKKYKINNNVYIALMWTGLHMSFSFRCTDAPYWKFKEHQFEI